ncbi:MAG: aminopeptidase P family protein [Chloroflexi bacterium]|nr:aminopeptidase P family protein [Chloroflexota bacterium]
MPELDTSAWKMPEFSLAERDRRWSRVRDIMRREGVDCLVSFGVTGSQYRDQADAKYLVQVGNNSEAVACVFPVEGPVSAITARGEHWPANNWVGECKNFAGFGQTGAIVQALRELKMERATIGLCGLTPGVLSHVRQPEGNVPYSGVMKLKEALPELKIVSATPIMGEARFVKSAEEIEFLRKGIGIAERALNALLHTAGVGVFEPLIMANMYQAVIAAGGSLPFMLGWVSGPFGDCYHRLEQPAHRNVQDGDYMYVEIEGRWGGYIAQLDQSVTFGKVPDWAPDVHKIAVECFYDVVHAMKPGVTFGELREAARKVSRHPETQGALIMHGRGLGDDGPLILPQDRESPADKLPLQEGNAFIIKPYVFYKGLREVAHVGDSVLVTAGGAERLGSRPIEHYWHAD